MITVWAVIIVGGYSVFCSVGLGCDYGRGYSVVDFFFLLCMIWL